MMQRHLWLLGNALHMEADQISKGALRQNKTHRIKYDLA